MGKKIEYRKRKDSDTWHWCTNCSKWPTEDYDVWCGEGRPSNGELDDEGTGQRRGHP